MRDVLAFARGEDAASGVQTAESAALAANAESTGDPFARGLEPVVDELVDDETKRQKNFSVTVNRMRLTRRVCPCRCECRIAWASVAAGFPNQP